ncbi:IS3 family transposase [Roseibacillus persicicus]
MIEKAHKKLSIRKQCELLNVNRNRLEPRTERITREDELIMRCLDELHMEFPFLGNRKLRRELRDHGWWIGRSRMRRLMRIMGIVAMVPQPTTSKPNKEHTIYPYLLRGREVGDVDEVWCADITYIPMAKGHAYLVAIMDWHSRAVLSWELSNTMDSSFCVRALNEAMRRTGRIPKIFNTDQGAQFTGRNWVSTLEANGIEISMDGKGRWMDNVFIERLWRSLKYEKIRLWSYDTVGELRTHIDDWMNYYNHRRKHQTHDYATPWSIYQPTIAKAA